MNNRIYDSFEILNSAHIATRGSDPLNIAVFSHPSDHSVAEEVAQELMAHVVCDISLECEAHPAFDDTDLRLFLSRLDLAVFIVSNAFVEEESEARCRALRIAQNDRIRLLTIQVDKGIELAFSDTCGHYQLLNRTGANYGEDLGTFIDYFENRWIIQSTADQQESATLIRARGFLSYRKRDRVQLIRTLDRVRSCPQLLDVSLWFDDALVPGECYDEQIEQKLSDSDFVVFIATPSLLEEGNYVIEREYPKAIADGKPCMAVLMGGVGEEAFRTSFPQIGTVVEWDDADALERALLCLTKTPDDYDLDLRRLRLLAGCYYRGTHSERNSRIGYQLYMRAAEKGDARSMAHIGFEYYRGLSLPKDLQAARRWMERAAPDLAALMRTTPIEEHDASVALELSNITLALFEICMREGDLDGSLAATELRYEALLYLRDVGWLSGRNNPGAALLQMGSIRIAQGRYEEAIACCDWAAEKGVFVFENASLGYYSLYNAAMLYALRGRARTRLLVATFLQDGKYQLEHRAAACDDLEEALSRCSKLVEDNLEAASLAFEAASDLLIAAPAYEVGPQSNALEAKRLYELAHDTLSDLLAKGDYPGVDQCRLLEQLALSKYYIATVGRIIPDYGLLKESRQLFVSAGADEQAKNLETVFSIDNVRQILDHCTRWRALGSDAAQLRDLFAPPDGIVNEGELGSAIGNFRISSYRCPQCGAALYKTVFPYGYEFLLLAEDASVHSCSRVFACPHGHFFAAPSGRRIVEGPSYAAAIFKNPNHLQDASAAWWWYFDQFGDLYTRRDD